MSARGGHVAVLILSALLLQCSGVREKDSPSELVKLRFALRTHLTFAPLAIAREEGFFEDEGLDVEFVDLWPSDAIVALPLGEVDAIGVPIFVGLFNAMEEESSLKIVADKGHVDEGCSIYSIVARTDLADVPPSPEALKGRKVERREGSIYDYIMETLFARYELTWEDVEPIEMMPPHLSAAGFETGQLDYKFEAEPILTILEDEGLARPWIPVGDIIPDLQFSVIVYGARLLEKEPELGARFMRAYLRGVRRFNEGATDRNVEIVSEFAGLDQELLKRLCWSPIDSNGQVRVEQIQGYIDWLREDGLVSEGLTQDHWWNPDFASEAAKKLSETGASRRDDDEVILE